MVGVGQDITELNKVAAEAKLRAADLTRLIDTANALEFARLLLVVPLDRTDIRQNGKPRFSPTAWSGLNGLQRREIIMNERDSRRALAFKIIESLLQFD